MEIRLAPDDFIPLEQFHLRWRWEPRWSDISVSDRAGIRALSVARSRSLQTLARRIGRAVPPCCRQRGLPCGADHPTPFSPPDTLLDVQSLVNAYGPVEPVRQWLRSLPIDEAETVVVWWDNLATAVAPWRVFREHWEDFCYPSGDDPFIWPLSLAWQINYWHEEVMYFARVRTDQLPPIGDDGTSNR